MIDRVADHDEQIARVLDLEVGETPLGDIQNLQKLQNVQSAPRRSTEPSNSEWAQAFDDAKAQLGSMRDLLGRHGIQVRGRRCRCPHPRHEDRNPSSSIYTAFDGDERVRCWSCGLDEDVLGVARLLGETIRIERPNRTPSRGPRRRKKLDEHTQQFLRMLACRDEWPFEWEAAKALALLGGQAAWVEVVRNWDYLTARGDVSLMLQTTSLIRGFAVFRFCTAKSVEHPDAIPNAVRRLVVEVELS